jgi:hypothetical protein
MKVASVGFIVPSTIRKHTEVGGKKTIVPGAVGDRTQDLSQAFCYSYNARCKANALPLRHSPL